MTAPENRDFSAISKSNKSLRMTQSTVNPFPDEQLFLDGYRAKTS